MQDGHTSKTQGRSLSCGQVRAGAAAPCGHQPRLGFVLHLLALSLTVPFTNTFFSPRGLHLLPSGCSSRA